MEDEVLGPATPGSVAVELDGRVSVYGPTSREVLLLDDAGTLVWTLVAAGTTRTALVAELERRTGADARVLLADVGDLVARLRAAGALP